MKKTIKVVELMKYSALLILAVILGYSTTAKVVAAEADATKTAVATFVSSVDTVSMTTTQANAVAELTTNNVSIEMNLIPVERMDAYQIYMGGSAFCSEIETRGSPSVEFNVMKGGLKTGLSEVINTS